MPENGPRTFECYGFRTSFRLPDDFELMYSSVRKNGFNAGREGFAVWRPIPPVGYVC